MGVEKTELSPLVEFGNKNSVKSHAINILSQEWPLNVRKLHTKVEVYRPGVSYHAVHKVVQQLLEDGVLKQEKAGYMLNVDWLSAIIELITSVKSRHSSKNSLDLPKLSQLHEGESRTFTFENLVEADKYRKQLQWEYLTGDAQFPYCATALHLRTPVVKSEAAMDTLSKASISDTDCYIAVEGDTPVDEWCADYYNNTNVRVQTAAKHGSKCEIMVIGDAFTQLHLPEHILKKMEEMYTRAKDLSELNISEFYREIYQAPSQIKFTVSRNADIANQLRRQILAHFETNKFAFCDIENTLVDGRFIIEAIGHLNKNNLFNEKGNELLKAMQLFARGKTDRSKFVPLALKMYASAIKGQSAKAVQKALNEFCEEHGHRFIFKHASRAFSTLRAKRRVVAITAFPEEIVLALRSKLAFDGALCTQLEITNGKYTGRITKNLGIPGAKREEFEAWLKKTGRNLEGSVGLGDSVDDIGFLERTSFPIAVNPDAQLAKVARCNKWFVFDGKDQSRLLAYVKKTLKGGENGGMENE